MRRNWLRSLAALCLLSLSGLVGSGFVPGPAGAQEAGGASARMDDYYEEERIIAPPGPGGPIAVTSGVEGGNVGYELAITGVTYTERGTVLRLAGIAYEVAGLATLRATPGLEVTLSLEALTPDGSAMRVIEQRTVRAREGGRFEIELPTPDLDLAGPTLTVRVRRAGAPGRAFSLGYGAVAARQLQVLTDRDRYEPGETVHVWTRLSAIRGGVPAANRPVLITLHDPSGVELSRTEATTHASGAVSVDIPLPETANPGNYLVTIASDETVSPVNRSIEVFERTLERLMMSISLSTPLVAPGANVRGTVRVTTPSGTPVRNANVEFYASGDYSSPVNLTTGSDGTAIIDTPAPAYLSGDVQGMSCFARVVHPSYGTATASAAYMLARTAFLVSATPEAGGLVPEIDSRLFLSVADPLGTPARAGLAIEVRGLGLPGGRATATTDAHGLAMVTVRLPRGAAARMEGGPCGYTTSTSFEVEVQTAPAIVATICAPVSLEAEVLVRARDLAASPGTRVEVDLFRRPEAAGRAVLVEALYQGRALAFAWADGAASRASLTLPSDVIGVIDLRARAVAPPDSHGAYDAEGETLLGTGTRAAILVRPADAFVLDAAAERSIYHVRETARIGLSTSAAPIGGGWATLVVRDEAQHAGESDYALEVIASELRNATRGAISASDELLVRATLSAGTSMEAEVVGAPPIILDPWDVTSWGSGADGVLRDPIAMREDLVRTGITGYMMMLEGIVTEAANWDAETRARVIRRGARPDFTPDALQVLAEMGYAGEALTLGGLPLTPAMLHDADPSFSFDTIARRVARNRLVFLMLALSRLGNPDDEAAARASAGQPPERWLSLLVQLGMVQQEQLSDPWGRPYTFRRVTGRLPTIVVSERALEFELTSPGPDGVPGNGDDVRDPFARAVPTGTPYAIASGEDQLMTMLSRISPGTQVLMAMAQAYGRLGLAADEERRGGLVTATTSEADYEMSDMLESGRATGSSAGGGYGMGAGAMPTSPPVAARAAAADYGGGEYYPAEEASGEFRRDVDADGIPDSDDAPLAGFDGLNRMEAMAAVIREDFPATLHFVGEIALDGTGHANVEIPLADAITTYRIEAIGWSGSGWTSSARTSLRVEQEAEIDAPVPEMAIVGDAIRMPVRVVNRGANVLRVRFEVSSEGDLGVTLGETSALEIPSGEARDAILDVRPTRAGTGSIVINCRRDGGDGAALDAVRRPLTVVEDARLVRDENQLLVESRGEIEVTVPGEASSRGPAEIRVRVAGAIFGAPVEWGAGDPPWASWAIALAGERIPTELADALVPWVTYESYGDARAYYGRTNLQMALVLGSLFESDRMTDEQAQMILRFLSDQLGVGTRSDLYTSYYGAYAPPITSEEASWVLLALAPALRSTGRASVRTDLNAVAELLRSASASEGAMPVDQPETFARVAAALALSNGGDADSARADEMLRRLERSIIRVHDLAWLEPDGEDGSVEPRIHPTSLLALAYIGRHRNADALPLLRAMADVARGAGAWTTRARALACASASLVVSGPITGNTALTIDGAPIALETNAAGGLVATSDALSRPGTHRVVATLAEGALAVLEVSSRYAVPWDVLPRNEARMSVEWTGETGARETRSALSLRIRNRGTRVAVRPIVEIQMPAGTELDEATREGLSSLLAAPPAMEGNVLRLELRPLAPGASIRLPIRSRWSVGGSLRGLGVSAYDDAESRRGALRSFAVLPSRAVDIADSGPEATPEEAEVPSAPTPIPPPIVPLPRPLAEVLR